MRERETGTIEQLVVTPIRPLELVVGKVVPYTAVAMFDLAEILVFGVLWFQVPARGSIPLLIACSVLFLLTTLGQGILISTVARSQQEAILLTFLISLPGIFLALITAHLTADLKQQASVASQKERRTRALYEMARELAGARTIEQASALTVVPRLVLGLAGQALKMMPLPMNAKMKLLLDQMAGAANKTINQPSRVEEDDEAVV